MHPDPCIVVAVIFFPAYRELASPKLAKGSPPPDPPDLDNTTTPDGMCFFFFEERIPSAQK